MLALAAELSEHTLHVVTDRRAASLLDFDRSLDVIRISTGKLRRYRGRSWLERMTDIKTLLLNIRDIFYLAVGVVESLWHIARNRPDVVFINGGAIGVPVSIACRAFRVPYIVHESDTKPGLANRIAAKHASVFLFGFDPGQDIMKAFTVPTDVVGIQLRPEFTQARLQPKNNVRHELHLPVNEPIVLITGGSLGGTALVELVLRQLESILGIAHVVHITGTTNIEVAHKRKSTLKKNLQSRYQPLAYLNQGMAHYMRASDIVISRAGATTLSEIAFMGKPAIIVPNSRLTGGHQDSNAELFKQAGAVVVLSEKELNANSNILFETLSSLLSDKKRQESLSKAVRALSVDSAGDRIISHILNTGTGER